MSTIIKKINTLLFFIFIIFCSTKAISQTLRKGKNDTTYSILGTWEVVRAKPGIDYRWSRGAKELANSYLGREVVFERNIILSNIDQICGSKESLKLDTLTQVSYLYSIDSSKEVFDTSLSVRRYYEAYFPTVTDIKIAYWAPYETPPGIDSLYAWLTLLNKDTLNLTFDVITLFLKRMSKNISLQIIHPIPPAPPVVQRPLTPQQLVALQKKEHQEYVDSMKDIHYIDSLLTIAFKHLHPFDIWSDAWNTYDGKLGDDSIELSIYPDSSGQTHGNYFYYAYKKRIRVYGVTHGNQFDLVELNNGKPNGYFNIHMIAPDTCVGYWTNKDRSVRLPVKMHVESLGRTYYSIYGGPIEVEAFVRKVKENILEGNKEWVANNVYYPIEVNLNGTKDTEIANKEEFIQDYDQIFYKKFVDKIRRATTFQLPWNRDWGVMVDDGESNPCLYISNTPGSSPDNYGLCISVINN